MKFALVDNNRVTATKGAKGVCQNCGSELVAKCGDFKVNHWAHKGIRNCDPWWENETEWHREWKSNFPIDWQEVIKKDEATGEKHIADICSSHGLVVEFQHSYIDPLERAKREMFYKRMVWVVDGTRLKKDYPRFLKAKENFRLTRLKNYFFVDKPEQCFPSSWLNSSVPILFDYKGIEKINYASDWRNPLYCLLPKSNNDITVVAFLSRDSVIQNIKNGIFLRVEQETTKQSTSHKLSENNNPIKRSVQTHYYDPRTKRFVRRCVYK